MQFLDKVHMPFCAETSGDSTGAVPGQGLHARRPPRQCFGPDVQETVEFHSCSF